MGPQRLWTEGECWFSVAPLPQDPRLGFPLAQLISPGVRAGGGQPDLLASSFLSFPAGLLEVSALKGFPLGPLLLIFSWTRGGQR